MFVFVIFIPIVLIRDFSRFDEYLVFCLRKYFFLFSAEFMMASIITADEFIAAAKHFIAISDKLWDSWKLIDNENPIKSYLKKECFITASNETMKAEYVLFYSLSYGVPQLSFNVWNSSGVLLRIEELRRISFIKEPIEADKNLYSVITQQEHPIFFKPYFIVHPCRTAELLACFKESSNILVTYLGMVQSVIHLDLSMEYGISYGMKEAKIVHA